MSLWRICGEDGTEWRAFALEGARVRRSACADTADGALAAIGPARGPVMRIGAGAAQRLPAPLLPPTGGALPGLLQTTPPDRLEGWTRLLLIGLTEAKPGWDGIACLLTPTLAQWVHLSAGEAVSCLGFVSPRLIAALSGAEAADAAALSETLSRPERLAAHLRTAEVTDRPDSITGHLLGAELAAARPYWLGQSVALIGPEGAVAGRAAALEAQAVPVECHAPDALLGPAFRALARHMSGHETGPGGEGARCARP